MKKISLASLAVLTALTACSPEASKTEGKEKSAISVVQSKHEKIQAFFADAMKERLALSPQYSEYLGDNSRNDEWDDNSDSASDTEIALYRTQLEQLKAFDASALNEADQLSYRLFELVTQRTIDNDAFRRYSYPINPMGGTHTAIVTHLANVHRFVSEADAKAYITRLNGVEQVIADVITTMQANEKAGILPPKFVYPRVLESTKNVISGVPFDDSGKDSALLAAFTNKLAKLELGDDVTATLLAEASAALVQTVKPAYEALIVDLERQSAVATTDDGVWKFPNGDAFYQSRLNNYTTTNLTADEVHQIGLDNVARIHGEMLKIMETVGFKDNLQDFFEFTRTDAQFFKPDTDEGRADYIDLATDLIDAMRTKAPEYFDLMPKAPMEVRAVEKFRENSAGKAFYNMSAPDGSRPGYFYANLSNMKDMPLYQLEALAYHEGIPGHHFQIAISQELEGVPLFQRVGRFTAYSEGWGLYTEELGKDMGFYTDPYSDFGRLAMELWRACRLVVDTGMHSKRWTREEAIKYLLDNTPNPEGDSTKAIERYIVMPGQATAYMIGKLKIMELRQRSMDELGEKFTFGGFHNVILQNGAVPLNIMEENVRKWIDQTKVK